MLYVSRTQTHLQQQIEWVHDQVGRFHDKVVAVRHLMRLPARYSQQALIDRLERATFGIAL